MLAAVLWLSCWNGHAAAAVPYRSFGYFDGKPYRIQSLYVPERVIGDQLFAEASGVRESVPGLNGPTGLFIDNDDYVYVSDTMNNRVVKMDDRGLLVREFGVGPEEKAKLNAPEGIYVASNGDVYVCDTGNNRIAVYNREGEWIDEIVKPDAVSLKDVTFIPSRVSMDIRGFLYVVAKGVNEGLIVISPDKSFDGFFGSNKVHLTPLDRLKRLFYTDEQLKASAAGADSVSDVFIDREGFVYTTTISAGTEQIKKYNVGGENLFSGKNMQVTDSLAQSGSYSGVTVDSLGNIYGMDAGAGRVYQFDANGTPVFSFGRKLADTRLRVGMFGDPVSIKANSKGYLFVTDRMFGGVQVFRPTEFLQKIHRADELFNEGQYKEAMTSSEAVLKSNVFYSKAHYIIGKALYRQGEWEPSMERFKLVYDTDDYSDSFWEWRIRWVQHYFGYVVAALAAGAAALLIAGKLKRRRGSAS